MYKLFDLETVNDEVWIPQSGSETTQTNGRKSTKSVRKKKAQEEALKEELLNDDGDYGEDIKPTKSRNTTTKSAASTKKRKADLDNEEGEHQVGEEVTQVRKTTKRTNAAALVKRKKLEKEVEAIEVALEIEAEAASASSSAAVGDADNDEKQLDVNEETPNGVPKTVTKRKKPAARAKKGMKEPDVSIGVDLPVKVPHEVKATRRSERNTPGK